MKFKDMTWEELKIDFQEILNTFSTEELVASLREYAINTKMYVYKNISYENNVEEYPSIYIKEEKILIEMKYNNEKIEINENINLEEAA